MSGGRRRRGLQPAWHGRRGLQAASHGWRCLGRRCAERRRGAGTATGEAGFTLIELMVAMLVLVIALAATATIVQAVDHQSATALAQGRATETGQVSLDGVTQYLMGAVTPLQAYEAQGHALDGSAFPAVSGYCWNGANPGPSPQSSLIASDPAGTTGAPSPPYPSGTKLVDPDTLSIIYAHDYAVELCAYPPGQTMPQVYEAYIPYSSCTSTGPGSIGDCTLDVVRYGDGAGQPYSATSDYATPSNGTLVDQIRNIWCDQGCQQALPCDPATEPAGDPCPSTETNGSCWSYLTSVGGTTLPAACSGITAADEASYTPPLFTYQGGASAATTANVAGTNLDLLCGGGSGSTCSPTVDTVSGGTPVCQPSATLGSGVTSTDDAVCLTTTPIRVIELRMTVMGNTAGRSVSSSATLPKVTVTRTIDLPNLATVNGSEVG
ncbi:MAG: prepilin-type N-terminal cleavage/methylation domain-containing protein [Actinomycetota bacterium]|nr:prepilin-type N-terminal cleavage/methylation domain-containing protein [Actinomycetota bacterium]